MCVYMSVATNVLLVCFCFLAFRICNLLADAFIYVLVSAVLALKRPLFAQGSEIWNILKSVEFVCPVREGNTEPSNRLVHNNEG